MSAAGRFQNLVLEDVEETSKELGRGSYGVVIEVIVSGTKCAAKKIHGILLQHDYEGRMMKKFEQEILVHSDQRHPSIVQLIGVYYPPDSKRIPSLIMEYLPFALSSCLMKQELELKVKYSILHDVAKGLRYLHRKHPPIVHRDLTANNILLTSSYTAKISDLGVSRLADTFNKQQLLTTAPGTQYAMPPEALKHNPVYDHKLDVFSYGCLILHVLTNKVPLPSDQFIPKPGDSSRVFIQVSEWERRSKYIKMIPSENEFLPLAKKCLADEPEGRPEISELELSPQHSHHHPDEGEITSAELKESLEKLQKECSKLKTTFDELEKRTSAAKDARKMFGDITLGDTAHQDVIILYQNYFKTAHRSLPRELPNEGKYEVWKMNCNIFWASFKRNKDDIIQKIIRDLTIALLPEAPPKEPLDESTKDLFRAFYMYIKDSDSIQNIRKELTQRLDREKYSYRNQAIKLITQLDPKYYYSFFQKEVFSSGPPTATTHRGSSTNDSGTKISGTLGGANVDRRKTEKCPNCQQWITTKNKLCTVEGHPCCTQCSKEEKRGVKYIQGKESIKRQIKILEEEKRTLMERIRTADGNPPSYEDLVLPKFKKDVLKKHHNFIVSKLIEQFECDLYKVLECTSEELIPGGADTRDTYKLYGLLLSASNLKTTMPTKNVAMKVSEEIKSCYPTTDVRIIDEYIRKAVTLTRDMLILLPPLVVTVYPKRYNEQLHITIQATWDGSAVSDSGTKLIYYRPILVYGNQLSVAVKGLVGNVEMKQIGDKTAHQMPQKENKVEQPTRKQENPATHYSYVAEFDPLGNNYQHQSHGFFKCFVCKESCDHKNSYSVGKYYVHQWCYRCMISNCTRTDLQIYNGRIVCTGHIICPNCHFMGCMKKFHGGYYYCDYCKNKFSAV